MDINTNTFLKEVEAVFKSNGFVDDYYDNKPAVIKGDTAIRFITRSARVFGRDYVYKIFINKGAHAGVEILLIPPRLGDFEYLLDDNVLDTITLQPTYTGNYTLSPLTTKHPKEVYDHIMVYIKEKVELYRTQFPDEDLSMWD